MTACKKCGYEVIWINTPGKNGQTFWTPYCGAEGDVQFQRSEDMQWITGAILRRHYCPKPGEAPRPTPAPPPVAPTPPRDMDRAQGQAAASREQIDAVPAEPEGYFDDDFPF